MSRARRFRLIAFLINSLSMAYTITFLLEDVRPFDWWMLGIEVAVLLSILLFDGRSIWRERRQDRDALERKNLINKRVAALRDAMSKGQRLLLSVAPSGDPRVDQWSQSASRWTEETKLLLRAYSEHAEAAFMLRIVESPQKYGSIGAVFEYISVESGVKNLRDIIERPDVYF